MADNSVLVTISGAALSLLLYENVRSSGDQMGLLLGNVQTFITKNVTDCDRQVEYVKHHINIDTVVPCSKDILQDALARIDREKLSNLIKNKQRSVVGWFRFRRHSSLQPTVKDKIMHKQFASHFVGLDCAFEEHFIMFLLNASTTTPSKSTHKYRHLCLHYKRGIFQPVQLRINNLGADAARHDGSDYKPVPENKPQESDTFTCLVDELKLNLETTSSVKVVTEIQKRANQYLSELMSIVCKSDEEISVLQKQVNELRAKVQKGMLATNIRPKEKANEKKASTENERICTTAQIHDLPRSTHSEDLFDDQSPKVINVLSRNSSSPNSLSSIMKNLNTDRAKEHIYSKGIRISSPDSSCSIETIHVDNSAECTRNKEGTIKLMNKGNIDDKFLVSKRRTNSPKSAGKKNDRHSYGDFGEQSHEESITHGRKEQNPRPTSFSENR